jgi:hypothetical protein
MSKVGAVALYTEEQIFVGISENSKSWLYYNM